MGNVKLAPLLSGPVGACRRYGRSIASTASLACIPTRSYAARGGNLPAVASHGVRPRCPCKTNCVNEDARMLTQTGSSIVRGDLGVEETIESDNIVRWDGERLYVEQDVYHNGQLVHRKYRRTVTEPVARVLWTIINRAKQ